MIVDVKTRSLAGKLTPKEYKRIFKNITIEPYGGCWVWNGSLDQGGYGLVWFNGRTERIHRVLYSVFKRPLMCGRGKTKGEQLDHLCRNRKCCNPAHLENVPHQVNVLRGMGPSAKNARKTHCKYGHPFPTYSPDRPRRYCKVCDNERHKKRITGPNRAYWLKKANEAAKRYYQRHKQ